MIGFYSLFPRFDFQRLIHLLFRFKVRILNNTRYYSLDYILGGKHNAVQIGGDRVVYLLAVCDFYFEFICYFSYLRLRLLPELLRLLLELLRVEVLLFELLRFDELRTLLPLARLLLFSFLVVVVSVRLLRSVVRVFLFTSLFVVLVLVARREAAGRVSFLAGTL